MPRKRQPLKQCQCGASDCTETTRSVFHTGHDSKLFSAIKDAAGGNMLSLKAVVEAATGRKIEFTVDR